MAEPGANGVNILFFALIPSFGNKVLNSLLGWGCDLVDVMGQLGAVLSYRCLVQCHVLGHIALTDTHELALEVFRSCSNFLEDFKY